jgi:histidinol-phosphate aminotransferase
LIDGLLSAAAEPGTRVVAIASPNDPTGELLPTSELLRLLNGLPDDVAVLLDESLVEFADAQPVDSSLDLLADHSRLFVFRSFSKAWGLAGLRVGYAIGGPGSEELLAELAPDLGVSEVSQAGALEALRSCPEILARRVQTVSEERARVTASLRERGFEVSDSQANFVWAAHPTIDGTELSTRLSRTGVLIASGAALGEPRHVRIALRDSGASARLLDAIDKSI